MNIKHLNLEFTVADKYIEFKKDNVVFKTQDNNGKIVLKEKEITFSDLEQSEYSKFEDENHIGVLKSYKFEKLEFLTKILIDKSDLDFIFILEPVNDIDVDFEEICWPPSFENLPLENSIDIDLNNYTVLPIQQGQILPNNWKTDADTVHFDGQFCSAAAYMPIIGQVSDSKSWMYILETPWDSKYKYTHKAGGPTTDIVIRWLPSLGKLSYPRVLRLKLDDNSDYNKICKNYRDYLINYDKFYSLKEKAQKNEKINNLLGASIVHTAIKTNIVPESRFYDKKNPNSNYRVVSFETRKKEILKYKELGAEKIYLHLDGWAEPGYDNKHPDILPPCKEAGGYDGLKDLIETIQNNNDLVGLHDQYRDYYFDAESFDKENAVHYKDGTIPEQTIWAGGHQTYMCTKNSYDYVKRNFGILFENNINPDCSYLDVFTCNEPDECFHEDHKITRKESLEYRLKCFEFLTENNIIPSSEECVDWSLKELVFCHYGPYEFMLKAPGAGRIGIPVPLFNLVYHDSVILPWIMDEKTHEHEDYMLYGILNSGMPYLIRDGAYPNVDGAFDDDKEVILKDVIERANLVSKLQEKLAFEEMVSHKFVDNNPNIQEAIYSDGTKIKIDIENNTFEIK